MRMRREMKKRRELRREEKIILQRERKKERKKERRRQVFESFFVFFFLPLLLTVAPLDTNNLTASKFPRKQADWRRVEPALSSELIIFFLCNASSNAGMLRDAISSLILAI